MSGRCRQSAPYLALDAGVADSLPLPCPLSALIPQRGDGLTAWLATPLLHNLRAAPTMYSGVDQLRWLFNAHYAHPMATDPSLLTHIPILQP
jgi:hypothetical protein